MTRGTKVQITGGALAGVQGTYGKPSDLFQGAHMIHYIESAGVTATAYLAATDFRQAG